jgi:hypothetical protein
LTVNAGSANVNGVLDSSSVTVANGAGGAVLGQLNVGYDNSGSGLVSVAPLTGGTLSVSGDLTVGSGAAVLAAGVNLGGNAVVYGTLGNSYLSTLQVGNGGTLTLDGVLNAAAATVLGSLTVNAGASATASNLTVDSYAAFNAGSTLSGSTAVTVQDGGVLLLDGDLAGSSLTVAATGGTAVIGASATASLSSINVENGGNLTVNGAVTGAPSVTVGAGGVATLNNTLSSPGTTWSVAGTLTAGTAANLTFGTAAVSGTLTSAGTLAGSINVNSGGSMLLDGTLDAPSNSNGLTVGGSLAIGNNGTANAQTVDITGNLTVNSGGTLGNAATSNVTLTGSGELALNPGGTLAVGSSGTLTVGSAASVIIAGSAASGGTFNLSGSLTLASGGSAGPSQINILSGGAMLANGAVGDTATSVAPGGTLIVGGAYGLDTSAGTLTVSGAVTIQSGATLQVQTAAISGSSAAVTVLSGGAFQVGSTSSPNAVTIGSSGQLIGQTGSTLTGAFTVSGGSTLQVNGVSNGSVTLSNGYLSGGGSIAGGLNASSATGSTIAGGNAPETITIDGASTLAAGVTDAVTIDGSVGYSQYALGASGTLNLNGAGLSITFAPGFEPYPGNSFTIVSNNAAGTGISAATFGTATVGTQSPVTASDGATLGTVTIGTTLVPVEIFYPGSSAGAAALGLASGASLKNVVLYIQGPPVTAPTSPGGGPPSMTPISGVISSGLSVQLKGAEGYTQYEVTGSNTLNLNGQTLTVTDIVGAIDYGTYTIVSDQTGKSYSNTAANSQYAIQGELTVPAVIPAGETFTAVTGGPALTSGATLANGAAISIVSGGNTYVLRIFYPQDSFNADGSLLKDVILERQTPLQILGSDEPGSSGTSYNGIVVDASYPTHTWTVPGLGPQTFYAYQDPGVLNYNDSVGNTASLATAVFQPGLQRSMITQITITFSGIVDSVDQGAITLQMQYPNQGASVSLTYSSTPKLVGDRSQVVVNFLTSSNNTTYQRSYDGVVALLNGDFQLSINGGTTGSGIHSAGSEGLALAANKVDNFFVLYGDVYGQGKVTGSDNQWAHFEYVNAPTDGIMNLLPYYTSGSGQYLFGTLPGVTQAQYQSHFFLPGWISSGGNTTAGWDPDVVYYDTLGIGYVTLADEAQIGAATGKTLPILPLNNPFS